MSVEMSRIINAKGFIDFFDKSFYLLSIKHNIGRGNFSEYIYPTILTECKNKIKKKN